MSLAAGTPFTIDADGAEAIAIAKINSTQSIVVFVDATATNLEARVVGSDESKGAAEIITANPSSAAASCAVCVLSSSQAIVMWVDASLGASIAVIAISGTTLTFDAGSVVNPTNSGASSYALVALSANAFASVHGITATYWTISGTTITEESFVTYDNALNASLVGLSTTKLLAAYSDSLDSDILKMCVLTVTGSTISAGTPVNVEASDVGSGGENGDTALAFIDSSTALLCYANHTDTDLEAVVISVSGTTPSANTPATVNDWGVGTANDDLSLAAFSTSVFALFYDDQMAQLNVSGTTVTPGTPAAYTTDAPTSNRAIAFDGTTAIATYSGSFKAAIITATAFSGYSLVVSSGGNMKSSIAVAADGQNIFFALEDNATGDQIIIASTRPAAPTMSLAYVPGGGSAANVFSSGDRNKMVFGGNFATDVVIVDHDIDAGTNTDISPASAAADIVSPIKVDPSNPSHIIAINKTDEDALETTDNGASWSTLNAALGIQIVAMDAVFFGAFFPVGSVYGGNDGVDENVTYSPNDFANGREDTPAGLKAAGAITGIDLALDID